MEEEDKIETGNWWDGLFSSFSSSLSSTGTITSSISSIFDFFDKSDIELSELELAKIQAEQDAQAEKSRQLTKTIVIAGFIILLIVVTILIFKKIKS